MTPAQYGGRYISGTHHAVHVLSMLWSTCRLCAG